MSEFDKDVGVEVSIENPDDFLKIRETLTRIGISVRGEKTLWQTAHILHRRGKYFIVHFKELFYLDGKPTIIYEEDLARRNLIVKLLIDWGMCTQVSSEELVSCSPRMIKIVKHSERDQWQLKQKYSLGANRK